MGGENGPVLLIEDDPDLREILAELIVELGYGTVPAADLAEGLQLMSENRPSLILLDAGAAAGRTESLARALLRAPIPLIVTSGAPLAEGRFDGIPHRFLAKPFRPNQLEAAIAAALCPTAGAGITPVRR